MERECKYHDAKGDFFLQKGIQPLKNFLFYLQSLRQDGQSNVILPSCSLWFPDDDSGDADSAFLPSVLEGVGLCPTYFPSHLELLQAVDTASIQLSWISPLHCKLCALTLSISSLSYSLYVQVSSINWIHPFQNFVQLL